MKKTAEQVDKKGRTTVDFHFLYDRVMTGVSVTLKIILKDTEDFEN